VYYYAEQGKERCFTDTVVTNYTLEIEVQILDQEVVEEIERQNAIARKLKKPQEEGVHLRLTDTKGNTLFGGSVSHNTQYEYETEEASQYTLCVSLTDAAFALDETQLVKTKVLFASEFHRNRKIREERKRGMFEGEANLIDGTEDEGRFHSKPKEPENKATEGHFAPVKRRISKINQVIDDILNYQNYEREQENLFKDYQRSLYNGFFNMNVLEMIIVAASAGYSVYSLRKFFVKKHIY